MSSEWDLSAETGAETGVLAIIPYSYPDALAIRAALDRLGQHYPVEVCQLQAGGRGISPTLARLAERGCRKIVALSLCQPLDRSLSQWLPGALASLQQAHPELELHWASPQSGEPLAELLLSLVDDASNQTPVSQWSAKLGEPGWQYPIKRRWHMLLCTGPRCQARGAPEIRRAIQQWLKQHDIQENDPQKGVQLNGCSCLYPCNQGPLLVINPGDTWYASLTPEQIPALLNKHLLQDETETACLIQHAPEDENPPC